MARSARRYDLFLPLTYNDGRQVEDAKFDAVERRLLAQFGGLTAQQRAFPLQGIWQGRRGCISIRSLSSPYWTSAAQAALDSSGSSRPISSTSLTSWRYSFWNHCFAFTELL
jgi:hypothetical protein